MSANALILFAHGARDPRWAAPFERLREQIQSQMPALPVQLAFLELMEPRLPAVVAQLAEQGCQAATVVPVFLGQGGHVLRDLPLLIAELQFSHPEVILKVAEAVGENAQVQDAMARYCISTLVTAV
jgi:sirohydrochlorin cobaltochelatase